MQIHQVFYHKLAQDQELRFHSETDYLYIVFKSQVQLIWAAGELVTSHIMAFLRPGEQLLVHRLDGCLIYDYISFVPEENEKSILQTIKMPTAPTKLPNLSASSVTIKVIYDVFYSADTYRKEKTDCHLQLLLYGTASGTVVSENSSPKSLLESRLRRLRTMISDAPEKKWDIAYGAKYTNLSESRFSHVYREYFGQSFLQDVIRVRIHRACTLLQGTDDPVDTIAKQLGYNNPKQFYSQFQQKMGLSPGEYRKMDIATI